MENAVPATKHNAKIDAKAASKVAILPLLTKQNSIITTRQTLLIIPLPPNKN